MKHFQAATDFVMGYIVAALVWLIGYGYGDSETPD